MEVGDSEKEEVGCALRFSRRKANVSFSDRPPPFILFLPLITRICRFIKSDVYSMYKLEKEAESERRCRFFFWVLLLMRSIPLVHVLKHAEKEGMCMQVHVYGMMNRHSEQEET
ncbi:hypothetical protein AM501_00640 [Aneurinibacillus migulanus]|uniref:hypothetical protein n=1 Tax=Aneurinibacillus migulanus TaxID=47500 RepID=UPI0005B96059|nr:hypothetical protein [Aneurinibacillus migulanus]KIV59273.1 hypothetical protein TS64_02420 [Aneurinibacillus migulanus]KPD10090.1 hypothetical protein AM501_00640 [Aneurinibacillus migulanus]MCP1356130.1 hypothetical protein [Aneurinibacillus migulanus]